MSYVLHRLSSSCSRWRQLDNRYLPRLLPSPADSSLWTPEKPSHPEFLSGLHPASHTCRSIPGLTRQRPQSHLRAPAPSVRSCTGHPGTPCRLLTEASPGSHWSGGNAMLSHFVSHFISQASAEQMTHLTPHKNSSLRFACSHYSGRKI